MQLIKRLKSFALAAIALAFAQTALAATFPVASPKDDTCQTTDGVAYYTDGSGTFYKLTTWDNLMKAVGVGSNGAKLSGVTTAGGTGKDDLLRVDIYNWTVNPIVSKIFGDNRVSGDNVNGWCPLEVIVSSDDDIAYVRFVFHNCTFDSTSKESESHCWGG